MEDVYDCYCQFSETNKRQRQRHMKVGSLKKLKTKGFLLPLLMDGDTVRLGSFQNGLTRDIRWPGKAHILIDLLQGLNGKQTRADVVSYFSNSHGIPETTLNHVVDALISRGVFTEEDQDLYDFPLSERSRYAKNVEFYARLDTSNETDHWQRQRRLRNSRVTIIGLGGVGTHVASALAASGVGFLRLVDADTVETSNLTRQLLYVESDGGSSKVLKAGERLKANNRHVEIEAIEQRVESYTDMETLTHDTDLLILSADEPFLVIEKWANKACYNSSIPWIYASYASTSINCLTFIPGISPCFECFLESMLSAPLAEEQAEAERLFPHKHAVIAPVAALPGHLAALETIRILSGLESKFSEQVYQINIKTMDLERSDRKFLPNCAVCGQQNVTSEK